MRLRLALSLCFWAAVLTGCPKPIPPPVTPPDASDAAAPPTCSCGTACAHLVAVAPQASGSACLTVCGRIAVKDPTYPCCVAAAPNARAADDCDLGVPVTGGKKPINGR